MSQYNKLSDYQYARIHILDSWYPHYEVGRPQMLLEHSVSSICEAASGCGH